MGGRLCPLWHCNLPGKLKATVPALFIACPAALLHGPVIPDGRSKMGIHVPWGKRIQFRHWFLPCLSRSIKGPRSDRGVAGLQHTIPTYNSRARAKGRTCGVLCLQLRQRSYFPILFHDHSHMLTDANGLARQKGSLVSMGRSLESDNAPPTVSRRELHDVLGSLIHMCLCRRANKHLPEGRRETCHCLLLPTSVVWQGSHHPR